MPPVTPVPPALAARRPPAHPRRPVALLALTLGVLGMHAALLGGHWWAPAAWEWHNGAEGARAPARAVTVLAPPAPAIAPRAAPAPEARPRPAPAATAATESDPSRAADTPLPPEGDPLARNNELPLVATPAPAADLDPAESELEAALAADPEYEGRAAPERVQLPGEAHLSYLARRGERIGQAQFDWVPDGAGYQTSLRIQMDGKPEVEWSSTGALGQHGLAPLRMVERRRGKDRLAVNFQRDKEVISFSGPSGELPLIGGSQDRASWLPQLAGAAQARAAVLRPGAAVAFQLATPRGELHLWRFTFQGRERLALGGQVLDTQHWVRQPIQPYDSRIEVWLAAAHQHLPVQLRLQVIPGRDPLELQLSGGLPATP